MTRIFISHSHSDKEIADKLVTFLLAALRLEEEDILCTSNPDQGLNYSASSITDQLKNQLKNSEALIVLITADSLHSAWIQFEAGSFWTTDKPIIPILGPGLTQDDLPGPLKSFLSIPIEVQDAEDKLNNATNRLAQRLDIRQKMTTRLNATLQEFSDALRAWQSKRPVPNPSQQEEIEQLQAQIQESERSHNQQLKEIETASQKEKQKLEQSYQTLIKEKDVEITRLQEQIEQLKSSPKTTEQYRLELKSEKGVDYSKLQKLLEQQKWKEADEETAKVMLEAASRESEGYLRVEDIDNFPCEDLRTINQLWLHYSDGKFGFSVQKEIYESLGGTKEYNEQVWKHFCDRVCWRKGGEFLSYSDITFNWELAPQAHLPFMVDKMGWGWGSPWGSPRVVWGRVLFSRAKTCNL